MLQAQQWFLFYAEMNGRRSSKNDCPVACAKRNTIALTSLVSLSFIVLWGPYYGIGVYSWFNSEKVKYFSREVSMPTTI